MNKKNLADLVINCIQNEHKLDQHTQLKNSIKMNKDKYE